MNKEVAEAKGIEDTFNKVIAKHFSNVKKWPPSYRRHQEQQNDRISHVILQLKQ